jgi:hypothetical protein
MTVRALPNFDALLGALRQGDARFVVVIGLSGEAAKGREKPYHLDVLIARDEENLERVARILAPFAPRPRGATSDSELPFDRSTLEAEVNLAFSTDRGDLDLLGELPGGLKHDDVTVKSIVIKLFGHTVRCLDYPAYTREMSETHPPEEDDESIEDLEAELERRLKRSAERKDPSVPPDSSVPDDAADLDSREQHPD